jgi:peptide/nickel transport system substrate-binding protein
VNTAPLDAPRFEALQDELDGVMYSKSSGILDPWIGMNAGRPPFNDPRVRQAVDLAINRQAMIRQIAFGDGKLNGPIPWGNEFWALSQEELAATYVHDVGEARRLLNAAGISNASIGHVITTALPLGREVGQTFKEQMKEIGIEVNIEVLEQNAFIERVFQKQQFDTCGFDWFPVLDPTVSLRFVDKDDLFARVFSFNEPGIAPLYEATQSTFELDARKAAMDELQRAVLKAHGPVLHLFDPYQYNLWWPWVHEWRPENTELNGYNNDIWLSDRT